jgi:hypothetical protein
MVNLRMKKTMKKNKVKKHKKYSRKHKKTIKQKRQHKRGKYSKKMRGGDICLKEVTDKTPPEVNRIGDENTNLPKKSSWSFGSLFGNKKTETPPIETTPIETNPIETNPIEQVKIVDEKITDDIKNPLLSPEIEDTSIVSSPLQPGEAGFVKPPPPSTPNPYLNTTPNKIEDTKIENSEIIEDSTSPPLPPVESKNPNNMLDQIKEGVKLKSVNKISNIPPPPPAKKNELSDVADVFEKGIKEKFKNTGMNQEEEDEEDINNTWRDSEGGKTRRRRRKIKSRRKNAKKVSKKR